MSSRVVVPREWIDCERFLSSWQRFEKDQVDEEGKKSSGILFKQFAQLAQHFFAITAVKVGNEDSELDWKEKHAQLESAVKTMETQIRLDGSSITRVRFKISPDEDKACKFEFGDSLRGNVEPMQTAPSPEKNEKNTKKQGDVLELDDLKSSDFDTLVDATQATEPVEIKRTMRQKLGIDGKKAASKTVTPSKSRLNSSSVLRSKTEPDAIQSDMINMAQILKERTKSINSALTADIKVLDQVGESAETNTDLLNRENVILTRQLETSIGLWSAIWLVLFLFCVFMMMYGYIKFTRK
uniref:Uncharacterized protein AlNc14C33G3018 n=1 Tax=Albugo laibachii Nc14 TaxID=890382 RepID=F0W841_9STRA|nr:conserved hypothetical protein [Albugo laibachii Nc14]|eukprot:CCA17324.1 conserved hypothetical protein [Albugo laibachii Nc14]